MRYEVEFPAEAAILASICQARGQARRQGKRLKPLCLDSVEPIVAGFKVGRNSPCPCGSGKKFKRCCE